MSGDQLLHGASVNSLSLSAIDPSIPAWHLPRLSPVRRVAHGPTSIPLTRPGWKGYCAGIGGHGGLCDTVEFGVAM